MKRTKKPAPRSRALTIPELATTTAGSESRNIEFELIKLEIQKLQ